MIREAGNDVGVTAGIWPMVTEILPLLKKLSGGKHLRERVAHGTICTASRHNLFTLPLSLQSFWSSFCPVSPSRDYCLPLLNCWRERERTTMTQTMRHGRNGLWNRAWNTLSYFRGVWCCCFILALSLSLFICIYSMELGRRRRKRKFRRNNIIGQ